MPTLKMLMTPTAPVHIAVTSQIVARSRAPGGSDSAAVATSADRIAAAMGPLPPSRRIVAAPAMPSSSPL